jgi:hypothetical protein
LNIFRPTWIQADLEFNAGVNSVVLPSNRGSSGDVIISDGLGGSSWGAPSNYNKVYQQIAQNANVLTASQSIYNIGGTEGVGSKTLPAGSPLGTSIAFKACGTYSYTGGTITISLDIGAQSVNIPFVPGNSSAADPIRT